RSQVALPFELHRTVRATAQVLPDRKPDVLGHRDVTREVHDRFSCRRAGHAMHLFCVTGTSDDRSRVFVTLRSCSACSATSRAASIARAPWSRDRLTPM